MKIVVFLRFILSEIDNYPVSFGYERHCYCSDFLRYESRTVDENLILNKVDI